MPRAGRYRRSIQIGERTTVADDGYGGPRIVFTYGDPIRGSLLMTRGIERRRAESVEAIYAYVCKVRGGAELVIKPTWRIKCDGQEYDIEDAYLNQKKTEWTIHCARVANDG